MLEAGVKSNSGSENFTVEYVFLEDPAKLSNNIGQVIRIAESEEKKLVRDGLVEEFNMKFKEMIELGTIREISQHEMDIWKGPVHYVPVQHVINQKSTSTPLRLVLNSSLKCPKTGLSLNSILAKGPNLLSDLWSLMVRFRGHKYALISDITKAYHSLKTELLEMHLRRIVWRSGDVSQKWRVYGLLVVAFGDRPAAALLEIVIKITVQMYGNIDPMAARRIENDMFVDDVVTGGELEEVL